MTFIAPVLKGHIPPIPLLEGILSLFYGISCNTQEL